MSACFDDEDDDDQDNMSGSVYLAQYITYCFFEAVCPKH